ncbi:hypothetical protein LTR91_002844 [Friedmanniomyces endolithicus]|uniref:Uncharacterized protein n=1 Tax=Friedmanniomyces endolithicus TaxID=329885 RepID=A0AAN6QZ57_9PEZI|nr:hypothetical protein LTR94_001057 [Friedmanniomyces endolithicus]KAK0813241.1 hypothetical protein LTR38_003037 [Friedmanniomyces endolithicus]KAK0815927.1 hypothetical protein LTR59_000300 [Friedmanniomyces endolithicus]KAK0818060.1 hypothetical protein LTR75_002778 [Friedmanniomyces endolithicus]KAK0843686.1 hypothetical protein LTR03_008499 [Friedmanniomyces endolithicus]
MSSGDYEADPEMITPPPRSRAVPQRRTPRAIEAAPSSQQHPAELDPTLQSRLAYRDKTEELNHIAHKDAGAVAMIAAIRRVASEQTWQDLVIYRSRHLSKYKEAHDDDSLWETYKFTRWEVVSKLLDFVFLHLDIVAALGKTDYRSLWAHTQLEESITARILGFVAFLATMSRNGPRNRGSRDIEIRRWASAWDVVKWVEIFQVGTATYQEEEDLLDFRIW